MTISRTKKVYRLVGVMYDITKRKMLEEQKEEFIGIASHELNTPVTGIKAYTEVLEEIREERSGHRWFGHQAKYAGRFLE